MENWLDTVKKEFAKRKAVNYYFGGSDSYLENKRRSILSDMNAGKVGTADTEERRRQDRMASAPKFFPAYEFSMEQMEGGTPGNVGVGAAFNSPMLEPASGEPIRSKPKFVVGQLSGPRLSQYITQAADELDTNDPLGELMGDRRSLRARSNDKLPTALQGQAYNWLADPIKRLAEGQVLLINNFQQAHPTGANNLAIVKDNGLVTQRLLTDDELKQYQSAMRSGLPIPVAEQIQEDYNSSPSQYGRELWNRVVAAAPNGTLTANQMTLYPTGYLGAAGYVSATASPSEIYLANEARNNPFVMAHESGHMIAAGDDGTWDETYRSALAADAQRQAENQNKFGSYENRYYPDFTPGLTTVSKYGSSDPQEAWGDLYGMYAAEQATNKPTFRSNQDEMRFADMYPQINSWIKNLANLKLSHWPVPVIR